MSQLNESAVRAFPAAVAHIVGSAVKFSAGNIVVATAGTDKIIGVIDTPNDAGDQANVRLRSGSGTAKVRAGGNIAVGDKVTATTAGAVIATTTATHEVIGMALETGVSGDLVEVMLSNSTLAA